MASIKKPTRELTLAEIDRAIESSRCRSSSLDAMERRIFGEAALPSETRNEAAGGGASLSPPSNTGGKSPNVSDLGKEQHLLLIDGKPMVIPGRRGFGGASAFVDWLNVTCKQESFHNEFSEASGLYERRIIEEVSYLCQKVFGFGVSHQRETGANFYKRSYVLGEEWGVVGHGGQRDTVLISLSGKGCAAAKEGWEGRLQEWLENHAVNGRITRIDLAHDDYGGDVSVDDYSDCYDWGLFVRGGRQPTCEQRGNWKKPNGKGRTFTVGNRENGKYFRGYEKGKQLGDPNSRWVRSEVELKSVSQLIPFDILTKPGEYLAAAYPCLAWISQDQIRIKTINKTAEMTYDKAVVWLKHQVGAYMWSCSLVEGDGDEESGFKKLMAKIMRPGEIPKRLQVPDFRFAPRSMHEDGIGMALA